ncbi:MAG: ATP-binding protein [Sinobacteraceae bacterium]|nr:ATP-binding protein [Nevskiaceae bacterium]MDI3261016.1 ATP-binding protein [Nevskiaceae bacterium]
MTTDWQAWAEQMTTGLALIDGALRLSWINPTLAEWLGLGPRSAVGLPLAALLAEPTVAAQARTLLAERRAVQWRDLALRTADGGERRVDAALQGLAGDTLLLELHALADGHPAASPLSATLRGFAHEVKNPLAGLRGAAQLLQRRAGEADLKRLAGLVLEEADRLAALADRLLHQQGAPRLAAVNIHAMLERLVARLQAEPAPPRLRHDYDPSLPDIRADADRLLQLALNLARNALEAGARTLTLRTRAEHAVRLGDRVLRSALRVEFADDGPGVPAELRETLFEPLVSGRADGTGLGLAIAREIAREHGGELRYLPRATETVFALYLPLERAP